jgi:hypothetical protein
LTKDDSNDLFYTGGKHRSAFLKFLGGGHVPAGSIPNLLERCGPASTSAWKDILRSAFAFAGEWRMKDKPEELQERLASLAALTASPTVLHLLASMLLEEVVDANRRMAAAGGRTGGRSDWGRQWESRSILGPLLRVNAAVDAAEAMRDVMMNKELSGMFPELLQGLRGYPQNRCGLKSVIGYPQMRIMHHHLHIEKLKAA